MPPAPRVLVADDQTDILQALRLLLMDAEFETDLVNSVGGVMDRLGERPYDLLLMDLNYTRDTTSGGEGLALIERVRARDALLPIVVMTGWGNIEIAVEAMRRGARSFVQKPWDDVTLIDVVRREIIEGQAIRRRDARVARDYEDARQIQQALLPTVMPVIDGCDVAASWTPASEIGGDCYDVSKYSDTRLGLSIADVVGKGLPAALIMSNLQAAVRAFSTVATEPWEICQRVNRLLCRNIASGKFVTFCFAVIDTAHRSIRYANAGHNPPILLRADGRVDRLSPTGPVLGVTAEWTYSTGSWPIEAGDRLVCFTDGVTEAVSTADDEFGDDRLIDLLRDHRKDSPGVITRAVTDAVSAWTGGTRQDDVTLLVAALG